MEMFFLHTSDILNTPLSCDLNHFVETHFLLKWTGDKE